MNLSKLSAVVMPCLIAVIGLFTPEARATWVSAPGINALSAVNWLNSPVALNRNDSPTFGQYRLYIYDRSTQRWSPLDNAFGASITVSQRRELWLTADDGTIWHKSNATGAWSQNGLAACGGGTFVPRRFTADSNAIAVGTSNGSDDQPYAISGTNKSLYWFDTNHSCWVKMPVLPSDSALKDVAIYPNSNGARNAPWAVDFGQRIYRWEPNSQTWIQITTGSALGVNNIGQAIGSDGTSVWQFNASTGSFSRDNTWSFGAIRQIGTTTGGIVKSVLATTGGLVYMQL